MFESANETVLGRLGGHCAGMLGQSRLLGPTAASSSNASAVSCPNWVVALRTQYRCHPVVALVCSNMAYNGSLLSGISSEARQSLLPALPPVAVVDVPRPSEGRLVYSCKQEAECIGRCLLELVALGNLIPKDIAVICVFRAQVRVVREQVDRIVSAISSTASGDKHRAQHVADRLSKVQVATVDAFQGQERKVVLVSTVRSICRDGSIDGNAQSVGTRHEMKFVDDLRRVNVAISRAMNHVVLIGCSRAIASMQSWGQLFSIARRLPGGVRRFTGVQNGCLVPTSGNLEHLLQIRTAPSHGSVALSSAIGRILRSSHPAT